MTTPSQDLKVCKTCKIEKPVNEYRTRLLTRRRRKPTLWTMPSCILCMRKYHLGYYYKDHERNKVDSNVRQKAKLRRLKEAVFAAYGGYICACCGETEKAFLSVDHVNNDGYMRRREGQQRSGIPLYRWIIAHNFPADFQILCMNCNFGKKMNGGICPHQVRRNDHSLVEVGSSEPKRSTSPVDDDMVSPTVESGSSFVN